MTIEQLSDDYSARRISTAEFKARFQAIIDAQPPPSTQDVVESAERLRAALPDNAAPALVASVTVLAMALERVTRAWSEQLATACSE